MRAGSPERAGAAGAPVVVQRRGVTGVPGLQRHLHRRHHFLPAAAVSHRHHSILTRQFSATLIELAARGRRRFSSAQRLIRRMWEWSVVGRVGARVSVWGKWEGRKDVYI